MANAKLIKGPKRRGSRGQKRERYPGRARDGAGRRGRARGGGARRGERPTGAQRKGARTRVFAGSKGELACRFEAGHVGHTAASVLPQAAGAQPAHGVSPEEGVILAGGSRPSTPRLGSPRTFSRSLAQKAGGMDTSKPSKHVKRKRPQPVNNVRAFDPRQTHVLVIDDEVTCLSTIEKMLKQNFVKITCCTSALKALDLLRMEDHHIDIVLVDIYMPEMNGFKFLEVVGLEMNLPVVMMSADDEYANVLRGVTHGAVDFLVKPVRGEELKNIWQHVVRRFVCEDEGQKKDQRKTKKPRMVWTAKLHQDFVHAVNILGLDKAVPKKIKEIMNVSYLRREHIGSHLQKYRMYLKQLPNCRDGNHCPPMPSLRESKVASSSADQSHNTFGGPIAQHQSHNTEVDCGVPYFTSMPSHDQAITTGQGQTTERSRVSMLNAQATSFLYGQPNQLPVEPFFGMMDTKADPDHLATYNEFGRDASNGGNGGKNNNNSNNSNNSNSNNMMNYMMSL